MINIISWLSLDGCRYLVSFQNICNPIYNKHLVSNWKVTSFVQTYDTYQQQTVRRNNFLLVDCLTGIRMSRRLAFAPILSGASIRLCLDDGWFENADRWYTYSFLLSECGCRGVLSRRPVGKTIIIFFQNSSIFLKLLKLLIQLFLDKSLYFLFY